MKTKGLFYSVVEPVHQNGDYVLSTIGGDGEVEYYIYSEEKGEIFPVDTKKGKKNYVYDPFISEWVHVDDFKDLWVPDDEEDIMNFSEAMEYIRKTDWDGRVAPEHWEEGNYLVYPDREPSSYILGYVKETDGSYSSYTPTVEDILANWKVIPKVDYFDFQTALNHLHNGHKLSRKIWEVGFIGMTNDNSRTIRRVFGSPKDCKTEAGVYWEINQFDIIAKDWYIVE